MIRKLWYKIFGKPRYKIHFGLNGEPWICTHGNDWYTWVNTKWRNR